MKKVAVAILLCSSYLMGCQSSSNSSPNDVEPIKLDCSAGEASTYDGIISGKTIKEDSVIAKSVFLIKTDFGSQGAAFCTATLIEKNVLLTAAHCVTASRGVVAKTGKVYFSSNPACASEQKRLESARFEKVVVNSEYLKGHEKTENDMAIIRFEGSAPAGSLPVQVGGAKINGVRGQKLFAIGYGSRKGYSRFDENPVRLRMTEFRMGQLQNFRNFQELDGKIVIEQKKSGVCAGDSGGPLIYLDETSGQPSIMGIASAVSADTGGQEACSGYAYYNNALKIHFWLDEALKEARGF